jgi:hypothetical protein
MTLERLKRPKPTPPPPAPPPDAAKAPPSPPGPGKGKVSGPTVRFACGHDKPLAKVVGKPCQGCQNEAVAAARRARREREAAKRAAKEAAGPKARAGGRLPGGAAVSLVYDAAKVEWRGVLHVEGYPEFRAAASGQFRCLTALDGLYREAAGTVGGG